MGYVIIIGIAFVVIAYIVCAVILKLSRGIVNKIFGGKNEVIRTR